MCASLKLFFKYINCIIFKTKVQYVFLQYRDRFLIKIIYRIDKENLINECFELKD